MATWKASKGMTSPDFRAVLASWGVTPPHDADKDGLRDLAERTYVEVMMKKQLAIASRASSSKGIGTDTPLATISYIGSDDAPDLQDIESDKNINLITNDCFMIYNTPPPEVKDNNKACAAAAVEVESDGEYQVDDTGNTLCRREEESGSASSAVRAAAPEFVPSLRRALEMDGVVLVKRSAACAAAPEATALQRALEIKTAKAKAAKANKKESMEKQIQRCTFTEKECVVAATRSRMEMPLGKGRSKGGKPGYLDYICEDKPADNEKDKV